VAARPHAQATTDLEPPLSETADRFRVNALGDYRSLANLEPDDPEHQFSIGNLLQDLGAYTEAGAVFDGILDRWPNEKFRVSIRKGALRRSQGDYVGALATLDRLVAELGTQQGMRYHYHRGWTLSLLGRYQEAIAEYSEGLKGQSDYPSAYERRGCAYASLGRLDDALRDLERAKALFQAQPGGSAAPTVARDVKRIEAQRQRVAASAPGGAEPIMRICDGDPWDNWERPRQRSPLLPRG
jgi:tetratricopeptide (TPR) repeat protein